MWYGRNVMGDAASGNRIVFLLPRPGWPTAVFESDFAYRGGRLLIGDTVALEAATRAQLEQGVARVPPGETDEFAMRLDAADSRPRVSVTVGRRAARREDELRMRPSRSAWIHACQALAGSAAGFAASALYLHKAALLGSDWALKMGNHMAGWHLLLTCTLFPASVWGQRTGIRAVQATSLLFFLIHAGIALANLGPAAPGDPNDPSIAVLNALSGVLFLVTALYGQRAHRDMDPVAALRAGRI